MRTLIVGFVVLALARPALAESTSNPHLTEGIRLIGELEYGKAVESLNRALTWPGNTTNDRARAHLHLGIVKFNQHDEGAARESFKRAVGEDPTVRPPVMVSPKIQALFEQVRSEYKPKPALNPTLLPLHDDDDDESEAPKARGWYANWPAWTVLGVGVAAGVTGIALGVSSQSEKEQAEDITVPYDDAMDHADRSSSRALGANILFAAAGAAVITSGVLFYLGHRKQERAAAAVAPTSGGALVLLEIRR